MIIRVFDKKDGLLISLLSLVELLIVKVPGARQMQWTITRARSGYGVSICDLEDRLEASSSIDISLGDLRSWLQRGEYFVSARLVSASEKISFGIEDSTYLYIETESDEMLNEVKIAYKETEVLSD